MLVRYYNLYVHVSQLPQGMIVYAMSYLYAIDYIEHMFCAIALSAMPL